MVTALTLLHKSNELRVSVEGYKEKLICGDCVARDIKAWYPIDNSWVLKDGFKYRWQKDQNNLTTDYLYADPKLSDEEAHDMHLHIWKVHDSSITGAGFSYKQGYISSSLLETLH
jgi:hypothetical protein